MGSGVFRLGDERLGVAGVLVDAVGSDDVEAEGVVDHHLQAGGVAILVADGDLRFVDPAAGVEHPRGQLGAGDFKLGERVVALLPQLVGAVDAGLGDGPLLVVHDPLAAVGEPLTELGEADVPCLVDVADLSLVFAQEPGGGGAGCFRGADVGAASCLELGVGGGDGNAGRLALLGPQGCEGLGGLAVDALGGLLGQRGLVRPEGPVDQIRVLGQLFE